VVVGIIVVPDRVVVGRKSMVEELVVVLAEEVEVEVEVLSSIVVVVGACLLLLPVQSAHTKAPEWSTGSTAS
jgi:hypothetical protein